MHSRLSVSLPSSPQAELHRLTGRLYSDKNIPTMLIYRKGNLVRQVIGLGNENGLKGMQTAVVGRSKDMLAPRFWLMVSH